MTVRTRRRIADRAALVLRVGAAFAVALIAGLLPGPAEKIVGTRPPAAPIPAALTVLAVLVVVGLFTRASAAALSLAALGLAFLELRAGAEWFSLPVRDAVFSILFGALALTGGGSLSIDSAFRRDEEKGPDAAGTGD